MLCSRTQQSVDHGWMNEWMGGGGGGGGVRVGGRVGLDGCLGGSW